ncbi:MAG: hypothetical protein CYPHOPRED_005751 [Cyphobasidiales sp. Tagirdzhanova-0007]|nr:MAG: hypothetical protein CYPHOPRED_005751 [Cyphobasidiales sp. Tagirdzhanova-0007]
MEAAVLPDLPSLGFTAPSREELNAQIREVGKLRGYIFKQSITSVNKVNWYCSNKYGAPGAKCPASFRAESCDGVWTVTETMEHNDACTRVRQRVLSRKTGIEMSPDLLPVTSKSTDLSFVKASSASPMQSISPPSTRSGTLLLKSPPALAAPSRDKGDRPRSYSQTSTSTAASEPVRTPAPPPVHAPPKITILDPAYHFPAVEPGLMPSTLGKRKRSGSGSCSKPLAA